MDFKSIVKYVLALDAIKGAGTYVIGGLLILAGVVGMILGFIDPATGGTWVVVGYGLIRARIPVSELQAKLDEITPPK